MLSLRREGKLPHSSYFSPGALVRLCEYLEGAPFFFFFLPFSQGLVNILNPCSGQVLYWGGCRLVST